MRHGTRDEPAPQAAVATAEAEVAVVLKQVGEHRWTASLRSKGRVDVAAAAVAMGGGGHRMASGFTVDGDAESTLDRLRAAVKQHRFFGSTYGHNFGQQFGERDVGLVTADDGARMDEPLGLRLNRRDDARVIVPDREHPDTAREVEERVAVGVGDGCTSSTLDSQRRELGRAPCRCRLTPGDESQTLGAGDWGDEVDSAH